MKNPDECKHKLSLRWELHFPRKITKNQIKREFTAKRFEFSTQIAFTLKV